jgi:glyoxylase-like metal-dependent hydrolase (beta-lactamase superfamily II)
MTPPDAEGVWHRPGAFPVAQGIVRVPLPVGVHGIPAVNMYVLESDGQLALVDPGESDSPSLGQVVAGLAALGHTLHDVSQIFVTHAHPDHFTLALQIRELRGAVVALGAGERPSVMGYEGHRRTASTQVRMLRACGANSIAALYAEEYAAGRDYWPWGEPDVWLEHGAVLHVGRMSFDVIHTPGHTRGHIVLRNDALGLTLTGDHVLPSITPSIGYELDPEERPLNSYLRSLRLLIELPDSRLLPAHGPVGPSVHTRVRALLDHHAHRLTAVRRAVGDTSVTAYGVARQLRWTRHESGLDELSTAGQMLAVLEAGAHLDHLADAGVVVRGEENDVRFYMRGSGSCIAQTEMT